MATASESGAELFEVGYFGTEAYLAQSPQFCKQIAILRKACLLITSVSRGTSSDTDARHTGDMGSASPEC